MDGKRMDTLNDYRTLQVNMGGKLEVEQLIVPGTLQEYRRVKYVQKYEN